MALAKAACDREDIGRGGAFAERADIRRLDGRPIGHGIGKGHAEFDHVRAAIDQRVEIGGGVAVTGGQKADQRRVRLGEGSGEAIRGVHGVRFVHLAWQKSETWTGCYTVQGRKNWLAPSGRIRVRTARND